MAKGELQYYLEWDGLAQSSPNLMLQFIFSLQFTFICTWSVAYWAFVFYNIFNFHSNFAIIQDFFSLQKKNVCKKGKKAVIWKVLVSSKSLFQIRHWNYTYYTTLCQREIWKYSSAIFISTQYYVLCYIISVFVEVWNSVNI